MKVESVGEEMLQVIEYLQREGIDNFVLVMRHAQRFAGNADNDEEMGLTETGKQAAYVFGKGLPVNVPVRFFSSPVGRCEETSALIEQGLLASGGVAESNIRLNSLYAYFVEDLPEFLTIFYDFVDRGEWPQFFRNWYEGKYSPHFVEDPAQSVQTMLDTILELLQEPAVGNICITHDWNLFLLKEYLLGLKPEDYEYIQYLEGVVIYKQNGSYSITNHQTDTKKLSIA